MAIADELEKLKNLHDKGGISDSEYTAAKQSVLGNADTPPSVYKKRKPKRVRPLLILVLVAAIVWLFIRFTAGQRTANTLFATAVHAPIELENEVQNLPAASSKALPLNLTYSGTLTISVTVVQGNPIDVFLTDENGLAALKAKQSATSVNGFEATKTKQYRRSGQLGPGVYYLVLQDTSLGILSAHASDISVNARLAP